MLSKRILFIVLFIFVRNYVISSIIVPVTEITKDTIWKSDTVKIYSDIVINQNATLTIEQGVVVEFQGKYGISVNGGLAVNGTEGDSVKFQPKKGLENTGWSGIKCYENTKLKKSFKYCSFKYSKGDYGGALFASNVLLIVIENSRFFMNSASKGGAVYIDNSGFSISKSIIANNISSGEGGGIFITGSKNVIILNNLIYNNSAVIFGGGLYLELSKAKIQSNKIYNNICYDASKGVTGGGGIALNLGSDTLINNLIFNNQTNTTGGGISHLSSEGICINNTVVNNKATDGGGISIINSKINYDNNIIWNNLSGSDLLKSHNLYIYSTQVNTFTNCLVNNGTNYLIDTEKRSQFINTVNSDPLFFKPIAEYGNSIEASNAVWLISLKSPAINAGVLNSLLPSADIYGNERIVDGIVDIGAFEFKKEQNYSGIYTHDLYWYGNVNVTNNITVTENVRLYVFPGTKVNVTGSYAITIAGMLNADGESLNPILFTRQVSKKDVVPSTPEEGWGGIRFVENVTNSNSLLNNCIFEYCNNYQPALNNGGAIYCTKSAQLKIQNSIFRYCGASNGGAVYTENNPNLKIINCLFYSNTAINGAVFYILNSDIQIVNCTTYNNSADNGGGVYCTNSDPSIENTIFWKNSAKKGDQFFLSDNNSDPNIYYSVLDKGLSGLDGPGAGNNFTGNYISNIDKNPLFNNPDKLNQFSLKTQSPCINAGNPQTTESIVGKIDLGGNKRIIKVIDIGAYENQSIIKVGLIPDLSLTANSGIYTIKLSDYFKTEAINDTIKYNLSGNLNYKTISVTLSKDLLQIVPKFNTTGQDTVIINALSILGSENADTFLVKVNYLNVILNSPFNNYRYKLNEDQLFKWHSVQNTLVKLFRFKIVEVTGNQTPEQAMSINPVWYIDSIANPADASLLSLLIKKKFPVYGKMAWQVFAIGYNSEVHGMSQVQLFYGAPLLNSFYAGINIVNVDTTTQHDLLNLTGKGNINIPGKPKISFDFKNLTLRFENNVYYLESGKITLPFADNYTVTPTYMPNGEVLVATDSLMITSTGFSVQCTANWRFPLNNTYEYQISGLNLDYNKYNPSGIIKLSSITFHPETLPATIMVIDNQSVLKLLDNLTYTPSINGIFKIPVNNTSEYLNDSIQFSFSGVSSLDYFECLGSNQQKLRLNQLVSIDPLMYTFDFSANLSPVSNLSNDWNGIWISQFKIVFSDQPLDYPLVLGSVDGIIMDARNNANLKYLYSTNGLEVKIDTIFSTSIISKFDGFNGSLNSLKFNRPVNQSIPDEFTGSVIIPYINETSQFNYVSLFNGLNYYPALQQPIPGFSFYPFTERLIENMQIVSGNIKYEGVIDQTLKTIKFIIPDTVNLSSLSAYFVVHGNKVNMGSKNQVRGITLNNFSSPIIYRIYAGNGTYYDYVITVYKLITGIPDLSVEPSIQLYPNPADDFIKLECNNSLNLQILIFDLKGKIVHQQQLKKNDDIIPINFLHSGMYILKVQSNTFIKTIRFIKR